MMFKYVKFFVYTILLSTTPVIAKEKLTFLISNSEIKSNLNRNVKTSIGSDITRMILRELKEFDITFHISSSVEFEIILNSKRPVCSSPMLKTSERVQRYLYSMPVVLYPNHKLFYPIKYHPLTNEVLNKTGQLKSLKKLFLAYPERTLTVGKGRSYGDFLDYEISELEGANVIIRGGLYEFTKIPQMLVRNRVDFALIYPVLYQGIMNKDFFEEKTASVAIEGVLPYSKGFIVCTKTDLGNRVISKINEIAKSLHSDEKFYQAHINYISGMDVKNFKKHFDSIFLK